MWGLIRRFSTEETKLGHESDSDGDNAHHRDQYPHHDHRDKDGVNGVFTPTSRRALTPSPFRPPPLEPLMLHGYRSSTLPSARLLTTAIAEEIRTMIPERLRIVEDWHLIYSLEQDGASLSTLYQKCLHYSGRRVGFVLVVKDQEGGVSMFLAVHLCCSSPWPWR
jgi:hypothetical protein